METRRGTSHRPIDIYTTRRHTRWAVAKLPVFTRLRRRRRKRGIPWPPRLRRTLKEAGKWGGKYQKRSRVLFFLFCLCFWLMILFLFGALFLEGNVVRSVVLNFPPFSPLSPLWGKRPAAINQDVIRPFEFRNYVFHHCPPRNCVLSKNSRRSKFLTCLLTDRSYFCYFDSRPRKFVRFLPTIDERRNWVTVLDKQSINGGRRRWNRLRFSSEFWNVFAKDIIACALSLQTA